MRTPNQERLKELKAEITSLTRQEADIKKDILKPVVDDLQQTRQAYAEEACFCVVGDKIQDRGYDPVIVSKILTSYNGFSLRGYKLKKNGDPYVSDCHLSNYSDDWSQWKVIGGSDE